MPLKKTGHERVRSYREAASGGSVEGRLEFQRMIAELPHLRVDCVIVDTLDRFTRNLLDGLQTLELLRGHGIGLLPLDWRRDRPIDVDDDRDWQDVVEEFRGAEYYRRRIRRNVRRAYQGRKERGATFTNRVAFGLRRNGDHLVIDEQTAWIVREADRRVLQGEPIADVQRWAVQVGCEAWTRPNSMRRGLRNRNYVLAGLRPPEVQRALDEILARNRRNREAQRSHEHIFAGAVACGICVAAGYPVEQALMAGHGVSPEGEPQVACMRRKGSGSKTFRHSFFVVEQRLVEPWESLIDGLEAHPEDVRALAQPASAVTQRGLEHRLAAIDQEAAALKARRDAAFDLLVDPTPTIAAQARKLIEEVGADEATLVAQRDTVLLELVDRHVVQRSEAEIQQALEAYGALYRKQDARMQNRLNRELCAALGAYPIVTREKPSRWSPVSLAWHVAGMVHSPLT